MGEKKWESPRKLFKAVTPVLEDYVGKKVKIPGVKEWVVIEKIQGNLGLSLGHSAAKPMYYEINGKHLISMLRFHAQMLNDKSITEDQFLAFENMEVTSERLPDKPMLKDQTGNS